MSRAFEPAQVQQAFSSAADSYDGAAELQREVARRLLERLDETPSQPRRVLDLGAGTGEVTGWLRKRYPRSLLLAADPARGMIEKARSRAGWLRPYRCLQARAEGLPMRPGSIDLLFSNLALQWTNQLNQALAQAHDALAPGGMLVLSTFGPATLWQLRESWAAVSEAEHVNRFDSLQEVGDCLLRLGFRDPVVDTETITLTYREPKQLLRELKAIGAHNINPGRPRGLTGRQRLQGMLDAYAQYRDGEGLWPASYEVIYASAWR